mmetsp:Transcript_19041/g.23453  ORF Transcript_19041/g.23453 Transcript_19041/m.23453 type:complete len:116 (+) Transcript_19041:300-647(+)
MKQHNFIICRMDILQKKMEAVIFFRLHTANNFFNKLADTVLSSGRKSDQFWANFLIENGIIRASLFPHDLAAFSLRSICSNTVLYHAIGIRHLEGKLSAMKEAKLKKDRPCPKII